MEAGVKAGKIRAIGVSNFHPRHLKPLLKFAEIKPAVNQIMVNPSDQQEEIVSFNVDNNILTEAYSHLEQVKSLKFQNLQTWQVNTTRVLLKWYCVGLFTKDIYHFLNQ